MDSSQPSSHRVDVVRIGQELFARVLIPISEVCNPDTLGAANNPEEFVMPAEGEDISFYYNNYLRFR